MATVQARQGERRRHTRYSCDLGVEVRAREAKTGYWGTLADICLGGCYINTFSPLPAGTPVVLLLKAGNIEFQATGATVTSHPGVGMGVQFSELIDRTNEAHLRDLIAYLARQAS